MLDDSEVGIEDAIRLWRGIRYALKYSALFLFAGIAAAILIEVSFRAW